jgi:hypothetical protein
MRASAEEAHGSRMLWHASIKPFALIRYAVGGGAAVVLAYLVMLAVVFQLNTFFPSEGSFAKAMESSFAKWNVLQAATPCGPELFDSNTSLLRPRSLGICTPLQQVIRAVGTGTDSCLSDLPDQRKEAGGSFD